jgi:hypothetical protein
MMDIRLHFSNISVTMVPLHLAGAEMVPVGDDGEQASDGELANRAAAHVSLLSRYFLRPSVPIYVPELAEKGVHHMDDVILCDYENFFHHDSKLKRQLSHHRSELQLRGASHGQLPLGGGRRRGAAAGLHAPAPPAGPVDIIWLDRASGLQTRHYVWYKTRRTVTRLPAFLPTIGELYYLRLLLSKLPARSHTDLKRHNGVIHASFRDAAVARGFIPDGREAHAALSAAKADVTSTPAHLRDLFCAFMLHNTDACNPVEIFAEFWVDMAADISRPDWHRGMPADQRRLGMTDALLQVRAGNRRCSSLQCSMCSFSSVLSYVL